MKEKLFIVVPCYNEEEVLPETTRRLKEKILSLKEQGKIGEGSRIVLVDDGSKDKTWAMIRELHEKDPLFSGVKLSRNRGHQNALLAGLMTVKGEADVTISMDADLQDDIDAVDEMLENVGLFDVRDRYANKLSGSQRPQDGHLFQKIHGAGLL